MSEGTEAVTRIFETYSPTIVVYMYTSGWNGGTRMAPLETSKELKDARGGGGGGGDGGGGGGDGGGGLGGGGE